VAAPPLHHVGIVVPNEQQVRVLCELFGFEEWYRGYVERFQALCIFTRATHGSPIEFVVPSGGKLAEFNRGVGGLHHIALAVDNLDEAAKRFAARGMKLLEAEHVKGAGPFLCNFLSPIYTRGILVELVQELEPAPR
jgi:methylmalonyl-CoA/ethylmalonyl-CoA epimerase